MGREPVTARGPQSFLAAMEVAVRQASRGAEAASLGSILADMASKAVFHPLGPRHRVASFCVPRVPMRKM